MSTVRVGKVDTRKTLLSDQFYIGRFYEGKTMTLPASALANPFKLNKNKDNRSEVIVQFRKYLWEHIQKGLAGQYTDVFEELLYLFYLYKTMKDITLMCWCKPLDCHGDIIGRAIYWMDSCEFTDRFMEMIYEPERVKRWINQT